MKTERQRHLVLSMLTLALVLGLGACGKSADDGAKPAADAAKVEGASPLREKKHIPCVVWKDLNTGLVAAVPVTFAPQMIAGRVEFGDNYGRGTRKTSSRARDRSAPEVDRAFIRAADENVPLYVKGGAGAVLIVFVPESLAPER